MKGLKKIALVAAISAAPFAAQAEMQALNDGAMGDVTGQAGVTIDINKATISVGEIAYQDKGFLVIDGLRLAGGGEPGSGNEFLDEIRIHVDVAGTGVRDDIPTGTAGEYLYQESILKNSDAALLQEITDNINAVETDPNVSDGDLVISMRTTGLFPVDFSLDIDSVSLAKETNDDGSANINNLGDMAASNAGSTVLVSDLSIKGNLGPIDIVVQEESNSMNINAYFNAAGEVTLPFMGTSLGFSLHNTRGQLIGMARNSAQGVSFAHAQADIGVAEDYLGTDQDALRVNVQDFSGDLDLTNITMGNGESIGAIYMTDLAITADMVVYGH
ncbi:DUF6160 family protein [Hydrocarboniclastica marina]|uniref:DUF6160 domain-containing protein n=1 Tax=Hydrocarboniclastica marina TaxID=2259620 RepID=A0A4P7XJ61_9ALTE|nr:DUF6160 family protein [Hydrocarboniclastica marina]MAL99110.1 hypothetical protein [Alteromonadaceae bacterium]QCF26795.1 hypothetical protein soil367_13115 [Hydrocarboniclastica marina]|tara:strand:+ start:1617 stop:2606 length:990 start_codon:yes stop_codon:yes gene_type:complete